MHLQIGGQRACGIIYICGIRFRGSSSLLPGADSWRACFGSMQSCRVIKLGIY